MSANHGAIDDRGRFINVDMELAKDLGPRIFGRPVREPVVDGFVLAISRRWKEPEDRYKAWHRGETSQRFGEVQLVQVETQLSVANLVGRRGVASQKASDPPIRYDAVRIGLGHVREHTASLAASLHMPRIGCGLAGGRWDEVEPIIDAELVTCGMDVTVYDFGSR